MVSRTRSQRTAGTWSCLANGEKVPDTPVAADTVRPPSEARDKFSVERPHRWRQRHRRVTSILGLGCAIWIRREAERVNTIETLLFMKLRIAA